MRWPAILLLLALVWIGYVASPFVSLWRLAQAVQAHDMAAVAERINVRALRASLTRQATAALAGATAEHRDLAPRERQLVAEAAISLVDPLVTALVTPETIVDILDDGWPQGLALPGRPPRRRAGTSEGLRLGSLKELGDLYLASDMHGFRTMLIAFPSDQPRADRFRLRLRLRLRLRGLSWRLVDLELPERLRNEISRKLVAGQGGDKAGENTGDGGGADPSGLRRTPD